MQNERALKICEIYPELSLDEAKTLDDFLVKATEDTLDRIKVTAMQQTLLASEKAWALLLAYLHNNIGHIGAS